MAIVVSDVKDSSGVWIKNYNVASVQYSTRANNLWGGMKSRCREGSAYRKSKPSYSGCHLSENFKDFQYFAEWCNRQIGYSLEGYHLDKDILFDGNRIYGEDTCVFVPMHLNSFLINNKGIRDDLPKGVYGYSKNWYWAKMCVAGKQQSLGTYRTVEEAHAAYKVAKEEEAHRWHQRLLAGEFVVDPRVIERMRTWTFED